MSLRFTGGPNGNAYFAGVPARDLTDEDLAGLDQAALIASGCYAPNEHDAPASSEAPKPEPVPEPQPEPTPEPEPESTPAPAPESAAHEPEPEHEGAPN